MMVREFGAMSGACEGVVEENWRGGIVGDCGVKVCIEALNKVE
jgi:hypothetical protein